MSQIAWARLAETMGRALQQLAADLRAASASGEAHASETGDPRPRLLIVLGERQQQILLVLLRAPDRSMTTREIAEAISYDTANAWTVLRRLEAMRLIELVQGSHPQRWRPTDLGRTQAETLPSDSSAMGA